MKKVISIFLLVFILNAPFTAGSSLAASQMQEGFPPINLSRSGSASQPQSLVLPDGTLQVFWWDQFDGLMSTYASNGTDWSDPIIEQIPNRELKSIPFLISDGLNGVHAFWIETKLPLSNKEEIVVTLEHSLKLFGQAAWSSPDAVADLPITFEVISPAPGLLHLAYLRGKHTSEKPAGVYFIKNLVGGIGWSEPIAIYPSIYMRSLTAEQADLMISSVSTSPNNVEDFITWVDPRVEQTQIAVSTNNGETWSDPELLDSGDANLDAPRVIPAPKASLVWQTTSQSGCELYEQDLVIENADQPEATLAYGPLKKILAGLTDCPQEEQFFKTGGRWLWVWGTSSAAITLTALDESIDQWSQPYRLSVPIKESTTEQVIYLDDINITLVGERLAIVGVDSTGGDIWLIQIWTPALLLAYTDPSPWSELQPLELSGVVEEPPALAIDGKGRAHAVWSQAPARDTVGNILAYVQSSPEGSSQPVEIVAAVKNEIARHPALLYEAALGRLHLVWSGGEHGNLLYQWVEEDEAGVPSAWSIPKTISGIYDSSQPQMAADRSREYLCIICGSTKPGPCRLPGPFLR